MATLNWYKVVTLLCGVTINCSAALADIPIAEEIPAAAIDENSTLQAPVDQQQQQVVQPVQPQEPRAAFEAPPGLERASGEKLATAIGHYSRARAYLIEAIRAFDKGSALASPDSLIDSQEWRQALVSRAEI